MVTEIVDCHTHVACAGATASGPALALDTSQWWERESGAAALAGALDGAGVAAAVVVQAIALYGFDCTCAAEVAAASGGRFAMVGAIDMAAQDPVAELDRLAGDAPLAGVRLFGVTEPGAPWLADGRGAAVFEAAAELDVVVVPTIFPTDLAILGTLAGDCPGLTVALDHCGFFEFGPPEALEWLLALAEVPDMHVKVSSHNLDRPGDPAQLVDTLADAFGTDRLCWGSDHPQHQGLSYAELVELGKRSARNLGAPGLDAYLGANSRRLWWPS